MAFGTFEIDGRTIHRQPADRAFRRAFVRFRCEVEDRPVASFGQCQVDANPAPDSFVRRGRNFEPECVFKVQDVSRPRERKLPGYSAKRCWFSGLDHAAGVDGGLAAETAPQWVDEARSSIG